MNSRSHQVTNVLFELECHGSKYVGSRSLHCLGSTFPICLELKTKAWNAPSIVPVNRLTSYHHGKSILFIYHKVFMGTHISERQ